MTGTSIKRRHTYTPVAMLPYLWLGIFFLVPLLMVLKISVSESLIAMPPYTPLVTIEDGMPALNLSPANYVLLFTDDLYWRALWESLEIATLATLITLLLGYPMAYALSRAPQSLQPAFLLLILLPFWSSFLIRVYAWIGILKREGLVNHLLLNLGLIDTPLTLLNTSIAVHIGIIYSYLPFMILPIFAVLKRLDLALLEAAADLGCPPLQAFWRITFPLSLPGVFAGILLVFIPAFGEFIIPDLLGGSETVMLGQTLWNEFFINRDWPVAAALAVMMLLLLLTPILIFQRLEERQFRIS